MFSAGVVVFCDDGTYSVVFYAGVVGVVFVVVEVVFVTGISVLFSTVAVVFS